MMPSSYYERVADVMEAQMEVHSAHPGLLDWSTITASAVRAQNRCPRASNCTAFRADRRATARPWARRSSFVAGPRGDAIRGRNVFASG